MAITSDAGENRRLTRVTLLVVGTEPVPVAAIVRRSRLLGIGNDERMLLGQVVHPGAGCEIRGALAATMQHDDERHGFASVISRNIEVVRPRPGGAVWVRWRISPPGALAAVAAAAAPPGWTNPGRPKGELPASPTGRSTGRRACSLSSSPPA